MDSAIIAVALLRLGGAVLTLGALTSLITMIGFNVCVEDPVDEVPHGWLFSAALVAVFGVVVVCATM